MKAAKMVITGAVLLSAGLGALLIAARRPDFIGERIKGSDSYMMEIQRMNGTDRHTLDLTAGDLLWVEFKTEQGRLYMEITAPDGALLYAGNGREATGFTITIPEAGIYTIAVEAHRAKGTIEIVRLEPRGEPLKCVK